MSTITTTGGQQQVVEIVLAPEDLEGADRVAAFLVSYYGQGGRNQSLNRPLGAVTTKDRFALVLVNGVPKPITDIRMRMLTPGELARAQGFPTSYDLTDDGRLSKTAEVRLIGNSVCPDMAESVIRSVFGYQKTARKTA